MLLQAVLQARRGKRGMPQVMQWRVMMLLLLLLLWVGESAGESAAARACALQPLQVLFLAVRVAPQP